jgi:hypothetical protein
LIARGRVLQIAKFVQHQRHVATNFEIRTLRQPQQHRTGQHEQRRNDPHWH